MTDHQSELSAALRQLPVPESDPDLLARILRNRAMGVRVSLPSGGPAFAWRWLAVAATVTVLIGGSWWVTMSLTEIRASRVGARDPFGELLGGRLWSEESIPASPPGRLLARYPLIRSGSLDLTRLSEGLWTYHSMRTTEGILSEPSFDGRTRLRLTRGSYSGEPAWVITTEGASAGQPLRGSGDTAYVDAVTLRPLYSLTVRNQGRTRIVESFSVSRGFQSLTIKGSKTSFFSGVLELPFPPDAIFTNDWLAERFRMLMAAIPLAKDWSGSIYQTGFFARAGPGTLTQHAVPLNIRVAGRDRVSVPAGRFDCWRVDLETHFAGDVISTWWTMWVSRDKGWVVKSEFQGSDYVRDEVLVSYEPLK